MEKTKSVNQFSLYKLIIFFSFFQAAIMFEAFENQLLTLFWQFPQRLEL